MTVKLTLVGGTSALLEYAGLRWLTDLAFSPPGGYAGGLAKRGGALRLPKRGQTVTG